MKRQKLTATIQLLSLVGFKMKIENITRVSFSGDNAHRHAIESHIKHSKEYGNKVTYIFKSGNTYYYEIAIQVY